MGRKILIISHNPIGQQDNMGKTLRNIYKGFPKEEICQIYLRNQEPDFQVCDQYFYIDETCVAKSIFKQESQTGYEISENIKKESKEIKTDYNTEIKRKVYNFGRKRTQGIYLFRDWMWEKGKWFSKELILWLEKQSPTCVFFMAGDYKFSMNIAMKIAEHCQIPLFSYYVDEYYFYKIQKQKIPLEAWRYQKTFKKLFYASQMNFCISEMMKNRYQEEFNKETEILMNTVGNQHRAIEVFRDKRIKMYYMGNISAGRWKNLSILSTVVKKLNEEKKYDIDFEIYSGEKDSSILQPLLKNRDVHFGGEISASEVEEKIRNADILVHTESFEPKDIATVKYSVSTKIPELLASGKILLAIGPDEVECINYLKRNQAGVIIERVEDIESKLEELLDNGNYEEIVENQKRLLLRNHNQVKNQELLNRYLN